MIISKKKDGNMNLKEKRDFFLQKNNISTNFFVCGKQVHGKKIKKVEERGGGVIFQETDGFITKSKNIAMGVFVADCLPISFCSEKISGIIHAGWKGLSEGIIEEMAKEIKKIGESIEDVFFEIGPSIGVCHFEVKKDVIDIFRKIKNIKNIEEYITRKNNKTFLDLKKIAEDKIIFLGGKHIKKSKICTFCNHNYLSYRREKNLGNMLAIIKNNNL